jgi:uncharacterized membrane protein
MFRTNHRKSAVENLIVNILGRIPNSPIVTTAIKTAVLFLIGGLIYALIEIMWRGYTHWTMAIAGGLSFVIIGGINEYFTWDMSLMLQGVIGSIIITAIELVFGLILNVWLKLGIWDYSNIAFNFMGQICLLFSVIWVVLSIVAVVLDDFLRHWLFHEGRPYYIL